MSVEGFVVRGGAFLNNTGMQLVKMLSVPLCMMGPKTLGLLSMRKK